MIKGGFILQPRAIDNSEIMRKPPHFREVWFYLLRKANHTDTKTCKRGELIISYNTIRQDLSWKVGHRKESYEKWKIDAAMKALTKAAMITTTKAAGGVRVKILQYDKYQDPNNYESRNEHRTIAARSPQRTPQYKNIKNDKNERMKERKGESAPPENSVQLPNNFIITDLYERSPTWFDKFIRGSEQFQDWYITPEHVEKLVDRFRDYIIRQPKSSSRRKKRSERETVRNWLKSDLDKLDGIAKGVKPSISPNVYPDKMEAEWEKESYWDEMAHHFTKILIKKPEPKSYEERI